MALSFESMNNLPAKHGKKFAPKDHKSIPFAPDKHKVPAVPHSKGRKHAKKVKKAKHAKPIHHVPTSKQNLEGGRPSTFNRMMDERDAILKGGQGMM